jgi:hypothetical protein
MQGSRSTAKRNTTVGLDVHKQSIWWRSSSLRKSRRVSIASAGSAFARSSSAPLLPDFHREFERRFGLVLLEAMGSTEAGGAIGESSGGGCSLDPTGAPAEHTGLALSLRVLILLAERGRRRCSG